jgi:hypothetical protein
MHFGEHRLRAFFHGRRLASEKLFPDFYQAVLRGECQKKVDDWYLQELSELDKRDFIREAAESSHGPIYFQGISTGGTVNLLGYGRNQSSAG